MCPLIIFLGCVNISNPISLQWCGGVVFAAKMSSTEERKGFLVGRRCQKMNQLEVGNTCGVINSMEDKSVLKKGFVSIFYNNTKYSHE